MSRRQFDPSNKPCTCLFCGRKLRQTYYSHYENQVDATKPPKKCHCGCTKFEPNEDGRDSAFVWKCTGCWGRSTGLHSRKLVSREKRYAEPGDYGDGFFCGLNCGYEFGKQAAMLGTRLKKKTS